nr:hypothetical protein [Tanacetum cinerariifolium]
MGEPLSLDRVFEFLEDELEPHLAYDFFAYELLPGYAGNPNNNNKWIEADAPLLGELGVIADEPMVGQIVDGIAEPIVKAEEQMIALVDDVDEDIAILFGDDDNEDDDSEGFDEEEEVWEVNEEWLMALVTPLSMLAVPSQIVYKAGGPSTAAEGQSFSHPTPGLFVPPSVIQDLNTRWIGTQVEQSQQTATQRDEVIAGLTQQVQALQDRVDYASRELLPPDYVLYVSYVLCALEW